MITPIAFIGPLGTPEIILIFLVMLLLFGAKKLPQLARGIGKSMGEFKRAREEFEQEITRGEEEQDVKKPTKPVARETQVRDEVEPEIVHSEEEIDIRKPTSTEARDS